jgi:hypothetical protein
LSLPGTVARPLKPRIDVKTLQIRHKTTPHSKVMNEFFGHLAGSSQRSQATRQVYGNRPNCY